MTAVYWTDDQVIFLINNYFTLGIEECSKKLNKTICSIKHKARRLSLESKVTPNKNKKDILNKRFGKLVAIDQLEEKDNGSYVYSFKCDCGNIKAYSIRRILKTKNPVISCGECVSKTGVNSKSWQGKKYISKSFFNSVSNCAKIRSIEFDLAIEYLDKLWIDQDKKCALSGIDLYLNYKPPKSKIHLPHTASLDRINSNLHYCKDNVRWVHKDLNRMKWSISDKDFLKYCKLVVQHNETNFEKRYINDIDNMDFSSFVN